MCPSNEGVNGVPGEWARIVLGEWRMKYIHVVVVVEGYRWKGSLSVRCDTQIARGTGPSSYMTHQKHVPIDTFGWIIHRCLCFGVTCHIIHNILSIEDRQCLSLYYYTWKELWFLLKNMNYRRMMDHDT